VTPKPNSIKNDHFQNTISYNDNNDMNNDSSINTNTNTNTIASASASASASTSRAINENDDVVQKFNIFFNSNLQRLKRQFLQFQLSHIHRQQRHQYNRQNTSTQSRIIGGASCRTKFTFKVPMSSQALWLDMFAPPSHASHTSHTSHIHTHTTSSQHTHLQFNNHQVGLTFPTTTTETTETTGSDRDLDGLNLQSDGDKDDDDNNNNNINKYNDNDNWFPFTRAQITDNGNINGNINGNNGKSLQSQWRIKRLTKHIGHGKQCYDFVRDCVLNWEFHNHQDDTNGDDDGDDDRNGNAIIPKYSTNGILKALPPSNRKQYQINKQQQCQKQSDPQSHHSHYLFPSSYYNTRRETDIKTNPIPNNYYYDDNIMSLSSSSSRKRMILGIEENDNPNILQVWTSSPTSSTTDSSTASSSLSSKLSIAAIGRKLVTYTKCQILPFVPSIYNLNPVCVVYDVIDNNHHIPSLLTSPSSNSKSSLTSSHHTNHKHQEKTLLEVNNNNNVFTSTAYATLRGHLLIGEERVTVVLRPNGKVDVEILSYSKPSSSPLGHLVFPIIGGMQHKFFINELEYIKDLFDKECRTNRNVNK
jgi:uncharacterized protein (UPF0548 family)